MPSQYVVRPTQTRGYFEVLYAQMFTRAELEARFADLIRNGWDREEARAEIGTVPQVFASLDQDPEFTKANKDPEGYRMGYVMHWVATYVEPGDVVLIEGQGAFIVNQPGQA